MDVSYIALIGQVRSHGCYSSGICLARDMNKRLVNYNASDFINEMHIYCILTG